MRTVLTFVAGLVIGAALIIGTGHAMIPCQEDEIVQGTGDFHSNGYWTAYQCINIEEVR